MRSSSRYVNLSNDLWEVEEPFYVLLSLLGVRSFYIIKGYNPLKIWIKNASPFDRDILNFPEIVINDLDNLIDIIFKPLFDNVWNAAGSAVAGKRRSL